MEVRRETERAPQGGPLCQGDIIKVDWPSTTQGPRIGVLINADCDLAHRKTDGVVAYLPVYTFREYISQFWAPKYIIDSIKSYTNSVLKIVKDNDVDALHVWLRTSHPNAVAEAITHDKDLKSADSAKLARDLHSLAICLDSESSEMARFKKLCSLTPDPESFSRKQISSAKNGMGDGHFIVTDLVGESSVGFVIRMRRIYAIPEMDIYFTESDRLSKSDGSKPTATRVARLVSIYRFKVLQMFAHQFSRIGLPDELTELSSLAIDDLVAELVGDGK